MAQDAAQEFAERVESKWGKLLGAKQGDYPQLISLLADELRAGGWRPKALHLPTPPASRIRSHAGELRAEP